MRNLHHTVIFGATSAIASEVARELVAKGSSVYCIGRSPEKLAHLLADLRVRADKSQIIEGISADLNDLSKHEELFQQSITALGSIDAVLIAQGSLPDQKNCERSAEATLNEIKTNVLSQISLLTLVANQMEEQGFGTIAAISSVAGDRGRKSNYVYGSAKAMLSTFMQGLCHRLTQKNIAVLSIKPGFVDTPMTASFEKKGMLWAQPTGVAKKIVHAMEKKNGSVYVPGFWRLIMYVIRHAPEFVFNKTNL